MASVSISTGCLARLENHQFYELSSIMNMMEKLLEESEVDGFEFVLLPEWDAENQPITPTSAPFECEKHSLKELVEILQPQVFPFLSVHANRDIGGYLCSEKTELVKKGVRLTKECLEFTKAVQSRICVFHFWDTWKEKLELSNLQNQYRKLQEDNPKIEISVENIPTKYKTPFQLIQGFKHRTLDLKWASLFNEFDLFAKELAYINNIHIQGKYQEGRLAPTVGNLNYEKALKLLIETGYSGIFTIELEGTASYRDIVEYIKQVKKLVR
ncbi:hypothetical protein HXY33_03240 [Candidatus Bathyarchaeota archaeon]|nr:hypothetical protein [Candidatus Bathyarchaeota archaeon]